MAPAKTVPENVLTGYVALSIADLKAFEDAGELRPEIFACAGISGKCVPLDTSVMHAIETALLQGTSATFEAAVCDTKWYVLKLTFVERVVADAFQAGKLHWSASGRRLEFWSPIEAQWLLSETKDSPRLELLEVPLSQLGLDDWGDRVLSAKFLLHKWTWRATCDQCWLSERFLWTAPIRHGGGHYCAECWHSYCKSAGWICDGLHECRKKTSPRWRGRWQEPEPEAEAHQYSEDCWLQVEDADGWQW